MSNTSWGIAGCSLVTTHQCFLTYTYIPLQVTHSLLVSYADDSTLFRKIVPLKEARELAAEVI